MQSQLPLTKTKWGCGWQVKSVVILNIQIDIMK